MRIAQGGRLKIIFILVAVNIIIMAALTYLSPTFMTYGNISAVLTRMSELGMLAIAETVVLISGGFDISIGAVMALSGAVLGTLHVTGMPFFLVIMSALLPCDPLRDMLSPVKSPCWDGRRSLFFLHRVRSLLNQAQWPRKAPVRARCVLHRSIRQIRLSLHRTI